MKTCIALRHVAFEDVGLLAPLLAERGFALCYREAGLDDLSAMDPLAPDLLVVLGGPIGAMDEGAYPFLGDEVRLLERRLEAGRPTLGVCLGAQLMARALGAAVYPAAAKEIGWGPVQLTSAGQRSCLRHLDEAAGRVLHWHGDTFDIPAGAMRLASTEVCPHQAFSYGPHALALQFHLEVEAPSLERWFIGHAAEIGATAGVSVPALRTDTARWSGSAREIGGRCLANWLDGLGPGGGVRP
jgi:GMP synthase (glutamine-hydrolysing)